MLVCLLKPVHWNPHGYVMPAGHPATSGYPHDNGFGHEEWNNSPRMRIKLDGTWYRLFHTEGVGHAAENSVGETMVFMYASHNRQQDLVGIAAGATRIGGDAPENVAMRASIRKQINTISFGEDAWSLPAVQHRFGSASKFRAHWRETMVYGPTWICPEDSFLWLSVPARIDALAITGKQKLQTRFSSHSAITADQAARALDIVPLRQRTTEWKNIRGRLSDPGNTIEADITELKSKRGLAKTTIELLIQARIGQGKFRDDLMRIWDRKCAVTECEVEGVLRASHVKPWRSSTNDERLNPMNGLLLSANIDALFDRYLVSFESDGSMLLSKALDTRQRELLGLPKSLRRPLNSHQAQFMQKHRRQFHIRAAK